MLMDNEDEEDAGQWQELGGGRLSLLAEYDDEIRRLGWFARESKGPEDGKNV